MMQRGPMQGLAALLLAALVVVPDTARAANGTADASGVGSPETHSSDVSKPGAGQAGAPMVALGGHFHLQTLDGQPTSESSFPDRWQLIYFGFTFCPDTCPTVLNQMTAALKDLGALAERIQPLFITIDPERDTADQLRAYLKHFDARIVGLRGSPQETDAAAAAYRVFVKVQRSATDSEHYSIEHSSFLFLMKPDGSFARLLQAEGGGHQLADQLRSLVQ